MHIARMALQYLGSGWHKGGEGGGGNEGAIIIRNMNFLVNKNCHR